MQKLNFIRAAVAGLFVAVGGQALAQPYPAKPIRWILSFTAGIGTDVFARKLAPIVSEQVGQSVVVENRPGAAGAIGAEAIFKSPPDGYSFLFASSAQTVALPHTVRSLPYDGNGFTPVMAAIEPLIVVVIKPSLPAKNFREFVDYAKRNPGKVSFGSSGAGSTFHMFGVSLNNTAGIELLHVPYKGTNLAVNDIMGGVLDMSFGSLAGIGPLIQAGKVRAIAIMGEHRSRVFPDLPAVTDVVPGLELAPGWFSFWGPPALPQPIVQRFHGELMKAMNTPDMTSWYDANGFLYIGSTPDQLKTMQSKGFDSFGRLYKALGMKPE